MSLDHWLGQKLYNLKSAQAKRFAEHAAEAMMEGDIEESMELRKKYYQLRNEATEALDHPWPFIAAYGVYVMLAVLGFAAAMYFMELVTRS